MPHQSLKTPEQGSGALAVTVDATSKKGRILEAALELFTDQGFAATRLDDVAARAGVAKGTLYLYFDSKEDLFRKAAEEGILSVVRGLEDQALADTGTASDLLDRMVANLRDVAAHSRFGAMPRLVFAEAAQFPHLAHYFLEKIVLRLHTLIASVIERGIRNGEFRPVPPMEAARTIVGPILMVSLVSHLPGSEKMMLKFDPESQVKTSLDVILRGLLRKEES